MIRCSELYRICTDRPEFDIQVYHAAKNELIEAVRKKGEEYDEGTDYTTKAGLVTVAKSFEKQKEKEKKFNEDPLPPGALNYLELLWLENNYGFIPYYDLGQVYAIKKGRDFEEIAIGMVGELHFANYRKNTERISNSRIFLTGECDIIWEDIVRDIKVCETWATYRDKKELEIRYFFQVIGYCILYGVSKGYVDYVLIENYLEGDVPEKFITMEKTIRDLELKYKVKTFEITAEQVEVNKRFILSRLLKAKEYYSTLTFEKCMNLNT